MINKLKERYKILPYPKGKNKRYILNKIELQKVLEEE
jgi:hypothetical protein